MQTPCSSQLLRVQVCVAVFVCVEMKAKPGFSASEPQTQTGFEQRSTKKKKILEASLRNR